MPILEINGKRVEVGNEFLSLPPDRQQMEVENIARAMGITAQPEPPPMPASPPQPIAEGSWEQLSQRVAAAGQTPAEGTMGPVAPQMEEQQRLAAARQQGLLYGRSRPELETGFRAMADTAGLGAPNFLEAATSGWGSGLNFPERHEFIKAADAGRAMQNPNSALAGAAGGIIGQALAVPTSAPATVGQAMRQGAILGGVTGGVQEAINSRGDTEAIVPAAASGAALGGMGAGLMKGATAAGASLVNRVAQTLMGTGPNVPTAAALKATSNALRDQAKQAGVIYTPAAMDDLVQAVERKFADRAFLPANEPRAAAVYRELDKLRGQPVTLEGLDAIRKMAGNAFDPQNKASNALARIVVSEIDDIITAQNPAYVLAGNATAASQAIKGARALESRVFKSDKLDAAVEKARTSAQTAGTGGNLDNRLRQEVAKLLAKDRGWTTAEKDAISRVVKPGAMTDTLRTVGRLSPTSSGLMAFMSGGGGMAGAAAGSPAALAVPTVGYIAKALADRATTKNVNALSDIIRAGGPQAAQGVQVLNSLPQATRDAVVRALVSGAGIGGGMAGASAYGAMAGQ